MLLHFDLALCSHGVLSKALGSLLVQFNLQLLVSQESSGRQVLGFHVDVWPGSRQWLLSSTCRVASSGLLLAERY